MLGSDCWYILYIALFRASKLSIAFCDLASADSDVTVCTGSSNSTTMINCTQALSYMYQTVRLYKFT